MWSIKRGKRKTRRVFGIFWRGKQRDLWQDRTAKWLAGRLILGRGFVLSRLERLDRRLAQGQRKWIFYIGVLAWSSFLFYLLGRPFRETPSSFLRTSQSDSSWVGRQSSSDSSK